MHADGPYSDRSSPGEPDDAASLPLVLASASPRRRELLARLRLPFTALAADVDEQPHPGESARALALRLARAKAAAGAALRPHSVVLAADTVVTHQGRIYGKPGSPEEARQMLRELRGDRHEVITGVCVQAAGRPPLLAAACTDVWMRAYSDAEIAAYVESGEPFDKAGGYAIQNGRFRPVARIRGCYTNVVGLPLCLTRALLRAAGVRLRAGTTVCEHAGT